MTKEAKTSKCWKCKHGICVRESESELVFGSGNESEADHFDLFNGGGEKPDLTEVEHEHVKGICFWRPEGITGTPPIVISNVKECSRFEEK